VLVLARGLLRLQRSAEVVELLAPVLTTFTTIDDDCTTRMLHGYAIALSDDADRGLKLLAAADAAATSQRADRTIKAEIAYYRAVGHWLKHGYREASRFAASAERAKVDVVSVRAMELRGFIALANARFPEALDRFQRAQRAYAQCRGRDVGLATQIIYQIAFLEMNLRSADILGSHAAPSGRTIPGSSFGPGMATSMKMLLLTADAWLFAHDGNKPTAFRKVHNAIRIASTPAWRVRALAACAAVFNAFGEPGGACLLVEDAAEIVDSIDWNTTVDEERVGLLQLAEVAASVKPSIAPGFLSRYGAITSKMDPTRLLRERDSDPRLAAWDTYVRGLVARAVGENERAGDYFRSAAQRFQACGFLWRAALALIELDATPVDSRGEAPLEKAAIIVRDNFPRSFLGRRLGSWAGAYVDPVAGKSTQAQRDILRRMLEGKSVVAIAVETNRARGTVRKHIENIHVAFGTHSYSELIVECFRRGIGAPGLAPPVEHEPLPRSS
jgi:DNA-binding CsgD family transcriptional regulator/tetratricopeptide (TPR) repeat protein